MTAFLVIATLAFLGAAVACAVQGPTLGERVVLAGEFFVFAGVGVAAVVQTRLYRVTIDDDGIEFVRWRRLRRMRIEQILGFRRAAMKGGTMLVFVPRDRSVKPLKVRAWFSLDAPFEAWLKRLPDVDALDREHSEAELLASSALGATPAVRKATLARARVIAHLLNWPAVAIALWVFVFPRPLSPCMKMTAVRTVPTASAGTRSAPGATRSKSTIGADPEWFVERWLVPCGAAGAVLVASWLVEAKQSVSRTWRRC